MSTTHLTYNGPHRATDFISTSLGNKPVQSSASPYQEFLTALSFDPRVFRKIRSSNRNFSCSQIPNAPEWACLIWNALIEFDDKKETNGQTLEQTIEGKLRLFAGTAHKEEARAALDWFAQRQAPASYDESIKIARRYIEKLTRPLRFPRIKLQDAFNRPRLEYLVYGMFVERGTGVVHSKYGGYKSFIFGVDLALCIALGRRWHGRVVKRKPVIYIIAEGFYETEARVKAYLQYHEIKEIPDNFEIIEMPIQIADSREVAALIEELREFSPGLIIIDTLAKCNVGRDENSSADMGLFTNGMETMARELDAFVLAIHHNNKMGDMRGSVSLPANVDASVTMKPSANRIVTIECDRVKGAPFDSFLLVGHIVELPERDETGNNITSLVFEATDLTSPIGHPAKSDIGRARVMSVFRDLLEQIPEGVPSKRWEVEAISQGISRTTFQRHRDGLRAEGEVILDGSVFNLPKKVSD